MIRQLTIEGFKAHKHTQLTLGKINLLTGLNSSGKTSVLQSLLLLRQSYTKGRLQNGLDLNSPLCDIGKARDARSIHSTAGSINFSLSLDNGEGLNYSFDGEKDMGNSTFLPLTIKANTDINLEDLALFNRDFEYISSSRLANVGHYPIDSYAVEVERKISLEYGQGELVGHFLEYYGEHKSFYIEADSLLHPDEPSPKLLDQVIAWEREISPRINIKVQRKEDRIAVEYGYQTDNATQPLSGLSSKNVGYGISYSLAVVVALLSAKPGALLLIENPEAHLHPRGQSKLANLMARVAASGVQIIVETHSDHIFNGLIRSIITEDIRREDTKVYYFSLDESNVSQAVEINYSDRGKIDNPQKGFFDQFDEDLNIMLGL